MVTYLTYEKYRKVKAPRRNQCIIFIYLKLHPSFIHTKNRYMSPMFSTDGRE